MDLAGFGQGAFYKDKGRRIRDENGKDVGREGEKCRGRGPENYRGRDSLEKTAVPGCSRSNRSSRSTAALSSRRSKAKV